MLTNIIRRFILLPSSFVLVLIWGLFKQGGVDVSSKTGWGVIFMMLAFAAMMFEFIKSGNITAPMFFTDTFCSVLAAVTWSAFLFGTIADGKYVFSLTDLFIAAVVIGDAMFCPFNSFRIALRSFTTNSPTSFASAHAVPVVSQPQPH